MLRTYSLRAPRDQPSRQVRWPVTVFRVEVTARREDGVEDPFEQLILDCASADERDPERIAALTGLPLDFVQDLARSQISQGRLDDQLRLSEAGRDRRMGREPELAHVGYMFRDDVTGEPLPVFLDAMPTSGRPPDGGLELPAERRRASPDTSLAALSRFVLAFHQDGRLRRDARKSGHLAGEGWADDEVEAGADGRVRLLDSGTFQEVLVEVWMDVDPERYDDDGKIFVGCPFGRPALNLLYQRRLAGTEVGQRVLRELEIEGRVLAQRRRAELMDAPFQAAIRAATEALVRDRPTLPERLVPMIRYAETCYQRTSARDEPAEAALVQYGILAEELLWELAPRRPDRPKPAELVGMVRSWPRVPRARARMVRDAISGLLPPDDEGQGLSTPGHLVAECERFAAHVEDHLSWPSRHKVGVARQLLPFAVAALWPKSDQGRWVRRALSRRPGLWGDLCRAIDFRNPAAHAKGDRLRDPSRARRDLEASRQALHGAIDACFPRILDPAVPAHSSEASSPSNPNPDVP